MPPLSLRACSEIAQTLTNECTLNLKITASTVCVKQAFNASMGSGEGVGEEGQSPWQPEYSINVSVKELATTVMFQVCRRSAAKNNFQ